MQNDHRVIVDFNTADPLIGWDSYENLSADGEGESCYLAISSWRMEPRTSSLFTFRSKISLQPAWRLSRIHTIVSLRALVRIRLGELG